MDQSPAQTNNMDLEFKRSANICQQMTKSTKIIVDILNNSNPTEEELMTLALRLNEVKFFKEKNIEMSELEIIASALTYRFYKANDIIFKYGMVGEEFYIILEGKVIVEAPISYNRDKFQCIAVLRSGQSFGELALITNQERSATIKAMRNSHMVVLGRKDYERVLKNIEARGLSELTKLLNSLPCFYKCSLRAIQRITYYFRKLNYTAGNIVYRVGDKHAKVYVVRTGEFEYKMDVDQLMTNHHRNISNGEKVKQSKFTEKATTPIAKTLQIHNGKAANILIMGESQMFAEDDAIYNENHIATVTCKSAYGSLMAISVADFLMVVPPITLAWRQITNDAKSKRNRIRKRVFDLGGMQEKAQELDNKDEKADLGPLPIFSTQNRNDFFLKFLKSLKHKDEEFVKKMSIRKKQKLAKKKQEEIAEIRRMQSVNETSKDKESKYTPGIAEMFYLTALRSLSPGPEIEKKSNLLFSRKHSVPNMRSQDVSQKKIEFHRRVTTNVTQKDLLRQIPKLIEKLSMKEKEKLRRLSIDGSPNKDISGEFAHCTGMNLKEYSGNVCDSVGEYIRRMQTREMSGEKDRKVDREGILCRKEVIRHFHGYKRKQRGCVREVSSYVNLEPPSSRRGCSMESNSKISSILGGPQLWNPVQPGHPVQPPPKPIFNHFHYPSSPGATEGKIYSQERNTNTRSRCNYFSQTAITPNSANESALIIKNYNTPYNIMPQASTFGNRPRSAISPKLSTYRNKNHSPPISYLS